MTQPNEGNAAANAVAEIEKVLGDPRYLIIPGVRAVLEAARDEIKRKDRLLAVRYEQLKSRRKTIQKIKGYWHDAEHAAGWIATERDQLKAELEAVKESYADNEDLLGRYVESFNKRGDMIKDLTTERNSLAEKVAAMEEDAEVGRLVREALSSKPTPVSIKVIQKSPSCCAVEVPWCSQFGAGETVLEALQALFQGEEL